MKRMAGVAAIALVLATGESTGQADATVEGTVAVSNVRLLALATPAADIEAVSCDSDGYRLQVPKAELVAFLDRLERHRLEILEIAARRASAGLPPEDVVGNDRDTGLAMAVAESEAERLREWLAIPSSPQDRTIGGCQVAHRPRWLWTQLLLALVRQGRGSIIERANGAAVTTVEFGDWQAPYPPRFGTMSGWFLRVPGTRLRIVTVTETVS